MHLRGGANYAANDDIGEAAQRFNAPESHPGQVRIGGVRPGRTLEPAASGNSSRDLGRGVVDDQGDVLIETHNLAVTALLAVRRGAEELLVSAEGSGAAPPLCNDPHASPDLPLCACNRAEATGGAGLLRVWETDTWGCIKELQAHRLGVAALAACPGREVFWSAGFDTDVREWDLTTLTGRRARRARRHVLARARA